MQYIIIVLSRIRRGVPAIKHTATYNVHARRHAGYIVVKPTRVKRERRRQIIKKTSSTAVVQHLKNIKTVT